MEKKLIDKENLQEFCKKRFGRMLQKAAQDGMKGVVISVSKVHVTS
jgi:hypothetical protein